MKEKVEADKVPRAYQKDGTRVKGLKQVCRAHEPILIVETMTKGGTPYYAGVAHADTKANDTMRALSDAAATKREQQGVHRYDFASVVFPSPNSKSLKIPK